VDFRVDNFGRTIVSYKEWKASPLPQDEKSYHIFLKKKVIGVNAATFKLKNESIQESHRLRQLSGEILSILPKGNKNALLIESKLLAFIYSYLDYVHAPLAAPPSFLSSGYKLQCIRDARELLENTYVDPPTIERLSKQVGINSNQLKIGFKHLFGITIRQFVIDLRLNSARQLIRETKLPLGQICLRVGYSNHGHFSSLYKDKFGIGPMKDRNSYYVDG